MSFSPILPVGGYQGWTFLQRTKAAQVAAFNKTPEVARDEAYFRANIKSVKTADDLVADRRLLKVALEAFGLDADINAKAFIRKVLSDGTLKEDALSSRLADKSYEKLSAAFGFGNFAVASTQLSDFPDKILSQYRARQFEIAVGAQNNDFRLSLSAERELATLAAKKGSSDDTKWFTVMGSAPLRAVFEKALGLPASLGGLDLDQQLETFRSRAERVFGTGTISQFTEPAKVDTLVRRYLVRAEADSLSSQIGSGAVALQMLQNLRDSLRNNRSSF